MNRFMIDKNNVAGGDSRRDFSSFYNFLDGAVSKAAEVGKEKRQNYMQVEKNRDNTERYKSDNQLTGMNTQSQARLVGELDRNSAMRYGSDRQLQGNVYGANSKLAGQLDYNSQIGRNALMQSVGEMITRYGEGYLRSQFGDGKIPWSMNDATSPIISIYQGAHDASAAGGFTVAPPAGAGGQAPQQPGMTPVQGGAVSPQEAARQDDIWAQILSLKNGGQQPQGQPQGQPNPKTPGDKAKKVGRFGRVEGESDPGSMAYALDPFSPIYNFLRTGMTTYR